MAVWWLTRTGTAKYLRLFAQRGRYFSVNELAAVIGWPMDAPDLPGLELGAAKRLVPSMALPHTGRMLGTSNFAGVTRPVAITPALPPVGCTCWGRPARVRLQLIKNLIRDDLTAGRGLAVVETNGDLIKTCSI